MNLDEMVLKFNQMPTPRPLKFVFAKRPAFLFLILIGYLSFLSFAWFWPPYRAEMQGLELRKSGTKVQGKVDNIQDIRSAKSKRQIVHYSYAFDGKTYRGQATENSVHIDGQVINIYLNPANPLENQAEFLIGDESLVQAAWLKIFAGMTAAQIFVLWIFYYYHFKKPRNLLSLGKMGTARAIKVFRGRRKGALIEFKLEGQSTMTKRLLFHEPVQESDQFAVVYDPASPERVIQYPPPFYEVEGVRS